MLKPKNVLDVLCSSRSVLHPPLASIVHGERDPRDPLSRGFHGQWLLVAMIMAGESARGKD